MLQLLLAAIIIGASIVIFRVAFNTGAGSSSSPTAPISGAARRTFPT